MNEIMYVYATKEQQEWITENWSKVVGMHMHIDDGFTILAMDGDDPVGVLAVYWKNWIEPLGEDVDGYIDIIEVKPEYRRQGIAKKLIQLAEEQCREENVYQIRAWSSDNKLEAIPMWKALNYGMCPAYVVVGQEPLQVVHGYYVVKVL